MLGKKFDQRIKEIVKGSDIQIPEGFEDRMDGLYRDLKENNDRITRERLSNRAVQWSRVHVPFQYGIVVAGIICLLLVIVPVSANLQGYWGRMAAMDEEEKKQYVSGVEESKANADSFSRALTDSEVERLKELTELYESGEAFPIAELTYIQSESAVQPDQVCFLVESSTFFLPDSTMTDEQLLEIIDFRNKRKYSVAEKSEKAQEASDQTDDGKQDKKKLSKKAAVAAGVEWVKKIYDRDVAGWTSLVERVDGSSDGYDIYKITYSEEGTLAEYVVSIGNANGEILKMHCIYNGALENISQGLSIGNKKEIQKCYKEAKRLAEQLNGSKKIISGYCDYFVNKETDALSFGTISFWLEYSDGSGLNVAYSLNTREYYQIQYIDAKMQQRRKEEISDFELSDKEYITIKLE